MSRLKAVAARLASGVGDGEETANLLVRMSPQVDQFLKSCDPPDMTKVREEKPTECSDQDWIDACKLQENARKASAADAKQLGHQIKRHSQDRMDRHKSQSLGVDFIHEASTQTLAEIAEARKEAREQGS